MKTRSRTPGISRIDQPAKHNHGYFVRLQRQGIIHSAFFSDKQYGGRKNALLAAHLHVLKLRKKFGPPVRRPRRWWAEIPRRKSRSGIVGVHPTTLRREGRARKYWMATWSPEPYKAVRRVFSVSRHGERKARSLAIRARREGLRNMK
ncbi:MAG TPA: hypothetical protein VN887_02090 [Candidatus Angelobacter sp.]|nr:hypothetical protein [Candidatus Angelobacter sp.]